MMSGVAAIRRGKSLVEDVYRLVRDRILMGNLVPGQRLHLHELATEFGVSLGVVREALTRLASEELATAAPQQGFRVRPLSIEDLNDLTWMRIEIESLALRTSIEHATLAWESQVLAAHHILRSIEPRDNGRLTADWMQAHSVFHASMADACGSPTLLRIRQELFDAAEIYRHWGNIAPRRSKRDVAAEHASMCEAALDRDADEAVRLAVLHIQLTHDMVTEAYRYLDESGQFADDELAPRRVSGDSGSV